jgi:hypothetical protein
MQPLAERLSDERMRQGPDQSDLSSALTTLLQQAGADSTSEAMTIYSVTGARRPAYHVLVPPALTQSASQILSDVLARPFTGAHSGWLVDVKEARAIIERAHRLMKRQQR